jgi:hypothetical protein
MSFMKFLAMLLFVVHDVTKFNFSGKDMLKTEASLLSQLCLFFPELFEHHNFSYSV